MSKKARRVLAGVAVVLVGYACYFFGSAFLTCVRTRLNGSPIAFSQIIGMKLRGAPAAKIARNHIALRMNGIDVLAEKLEVVEAGGGDTDEVVRSLIAAQKSKIPLTFDAAHAIHLAAREGGRSLHNAVSSFVSPVALKMQAVAEVRGSKAILHLLGGAIGMYEKDFQDFPPSRYDDLPQSIHATTFRQ